MKNWHVTVQRVSERTIIVAARTPSEAGELALAPNDRDVIACEGRWDTSKFDVVHIA